MSFHDPIRQSKYLRQTLSQDKKPVGFFVSAGCPLAVAMPDKEWPLIPDVSGLTKYIKEQIDKETEEIPQTKRSLAYSYSKLIEEVIKTGKAIPTIEDILSFLRGMMQISKGASDIRGFGESELADLEKLVCKKIAEKLDVNLPDNKTPYHKLAKWVNNIERDTPIEIFTTNYDLLMEEAFESLKVPYFDGFVGTRFPFFDLRAVEDGVIPNHWTRLWKIHGSINWYLRENKDVYRSTSLNGTDSYIIHPSHLKYDQSRKMPYLALIDRLNKFLRQNSAVLIMSGYSFSDEHLNDTILNALRANPTAMVIALLFGNLTTIKEEEDKEDKIVVTTTNNYEKATELAENRSNLSIWTFDEAIIGGLRAKWKPTKSEYDAEENIANAVKQKLIPIKDSEGKDTEEKIVKYEFLLGDFAVLGDFLQELIGKEQFKIKQDGV
ncbi:SIR2 family protein [Chitinophaga sancti]|uniref:SIR2 family protein n=1 Tax=Chitinophaga sancti TaxID=1004 RepID=A0A1K1SY95_9BACT|nr:SIR2 family protein [Chitinophaga sancti]WQD63947.1 SIR2 family protein [Chitinophaga sancti]WQG90428.1 SIR2 family protein [Chitinophaga sancti]SFW89352.1 SIR2-like domain-containing protein [Chitinophaga sancti]